MKNEPDSEDGSFYAKHGAPTEAGLCPECGVRPGTERIQNVTFALGEEPPAPDPDRWICRACLEDQVARGWTQSVENLERLFAMHPGDRQALERAASRLAAHLRSEIDRWRLPASEHVRSFLARHRA